MDSKPPDSPDRTAAEAPKHVLSAAARPHRGDTIGAADVGDVLLKFAVVLLCSINAVLWEVYTEAPFMAALWAVIAVWFLIWMIREVRNR
jgi:membrane protein YdbS with pleckstrin-like domain